MNGDPPVITPQTRLRIFRNEVFQNITDILARHQTSLAALFERQREQHPLILSVADIVLDSALSFQPDYDEYIKVGSSFLMWTMTLIHLSSAIPYSRVSTPS
jgi:hypothetical protein